MTKYVFFLLALVWVAPAFAASLLKVAPNRTSYQVGDSAIFRVQVLAPPKGPEFEYLIVGKWDGEEEGYTLARATPSEFYFTKSALAAGEHQLLVQAYIQDRALAKALTLAVEAYDKEILRLHEALLDAESPEEITAIEEEIELNQSRRASALNQLNSLRRQVGAPVTTQIQVN